MSIHVTHKPITPPMVGKSGCSGSVYSRMLGCTTFFPSIGLFGPKYNVCATVYRGPLLPSAPKSQKPNVVALTAKVRPGRIVKFSGSVTRTPSNACKASGWIDWEKKRTLTETRHANIYIYIYIY